VVVREVRAGVVMVARRSIRHCIARIRVCVCVCVCVCASESAKKEECKRRWLGRRESCMGRFDFQS
jgi:hypothetical protein